jgi:hypothetical protein
LPNPRVNTDWKTAVTHEWVSTRSVRHVAAGYPYPLWQKHEIKTNTNYN